MNAKAYWPVLLLTLLWPAAHLILFFSRFRTLTPDILIPSAFFLLPGLISSLVAFYLFARARPRVQRRCVVAGYVISLPIALAGSLVGGLMLPPLIGVTLYGSVLSTAGTLVGFGIGVLIARR